MPGVLVRVLGAVVFFVGERVRVGVCLRVGVRLWARWCRGRGRGGEGVCDKGVVVLDWGDVRGLVERVWVQ